MDVYGLVVLVLFATAPLLFLIAINIAEILLLVIATFQATIDMLKQFAHRGWDKVSNIFNEVKEFANRCKNDVVNSALVKQFKESRFASFMIFLWGAKGIVVYVADWGSDVYTAVMHCINGYIAYFVLTIVFILTAHIYIIWENVRYNYCLLNVSLRARHPRRALLLLPFVPFLVLWQPIPHMWRKWRDAQGQTGKSHR